MHYITTLNAAIIAMGLIFTSTFSLSAQELSANSVFYRALQGGNKEQVYVIPMTREHLKDTVSRKTQIWSSLQGCKVGYTQAFTDPLFSKESAVFRVESNCGLSIKTNTSNLVCRYAPLDVVYVLKFLKEGLPIGYGAEYLTPYERDYINLHCKEAKAK